MNTFAKSVVLLICFSLYAVAGEKAVLRNGFTVNHSHREILGTNTRLFLDVTGRTYVDVPSAEIDHFDSTPNDDTDVITNQLLPDPVSAIQPVKILEVQPLPISSNDLQTSSDIASLVRNASFKAKLDPDLVHSLIRYESGGNPHAVSRKGAQGIMQLMPATAAKLGVANSFNPQQNIEGGTRYLRTLLEQFKFDVVKALAAYNAGPEAVIKYDGVPPYPETRQYVRSIVNDFNNKKRQSLNQSTATKSTVASINSKANRSN